MRHLTTILLLCCLCLTQGARAQGDATARYEQLQKEMYRLFPSRDTEGFTSVTEQLKELAKERGDERMFYKAWGNQAMFDFNGKALDSLWTWNYMILGTEDQVEKKVEEIAPVALSVVQDATLTMPETVSVTYNVGGAKDEAVTWDAADLTAVDTAVPGTYTVKGTVTLSYDLGTVEITATVTVTCPNLLNNPSFENSDLSMYTGTDSGDRSTDTPHDGTYCYHFYNAAAKVFEIAQTVILEPGTYAFSLFAQGDTKGTDGQFIYVAVGEEEAVTESFALNGWAVWQNPEVEFEVLETASVKVGVYLPYGAGGWGTVDDWYLHQLAEGAVNTIPLKAALRKAANIDRSLYTEETLAVLDAKVAAAEAVLADKNANQAQVDAALAELNNALLALEEKPYEADNYTVWFVDEEGLATVNYYAFTDAEHEKAPWPGEALESVGVDRNNNKVYKTVVDAKAYTFVGFNNGASWQTSDLAFAQDAERDGQNKNIVYFGNSNETDPAGHYKAWPASDVWKIIEDKEPSCLEAGQRTLESYVTGATDTEAYGEALGHAWDEGEVTVAPTLTQEGTMTYHCTRCDAVKTEPISKLDPVDTAALEAAIAAAEAVDRNEYTAETLADLDAALAAAKAALTSDTLTQAEADAKAEALNNAVSALLPKGAVPITVFFVDEKGLDAVKYYAFKGESHKADWPGDGLTAIGQDRNGKNVYKIAIDSARYDNVIFNDGNGWQTQDLPFVTDAGTKTAIVYFGNENEADELGHYKAWLADDVEKIVSTTEPTCAAAGAVVYESFVTGTQRTEEIEKLDGTALEAAIAAAEAVETENYTEETVAALTEALAAAKDALANAHTQEAVDEAAAALNAAVAALELLQPKTYTVYFVNEADLETVKYYVFKGEDYKTAWPGDAAETVGTDRNGKPVFKAEIDKNKYDYVIFTDGAWQTEDLDFAADAAAQSLTDYVVYYGNSNQAIEGKENTYKAWPAKDVDKEVSRTEPTCGAPGEIILESLITGTQHVEILKSLNGTELEAAITAAEAVDTDKYTAETVAALNTALAAAKDALENAHTQEAVDKATADLNAAIAALEEKTPEEKDPVYYLVGSMTNWAAQEDYKLTAAETEGEFQLKGVKLAANAQVKITDAANDKWYPEGTGNHYSVPEAGTYDVSFFPAGGKEDYHEGFFLLTKVGSEAPEPITPVYYLVGTMNGWEAKEEYKLTASETEGEWILTGVALTTDDEVKVKDEANGLWYPDGDNCPVFANGIYDVSFYPAGGQEGYHEGCIKLTWTASLEAKPMTVYFVDEVSLEAVYAYAFCYTDHLAENAAWPGVKLESFDQDRNGKDIYKLELDVNSYDNVIFSNGKDGEEAWQTQDLEFVAAAAELAKAGKNEAVDALVQNVQQFLTTNEQKLQELGAIEAVKSFPATVKETVEAVAASAESGAAAVKEQAEAAANQAVVDAIQKPGHRKDVCVILLCKFLDSALDNCLGSLKKFGVYLFLFKEVVLPEFLERALIRRLRIRHIAPLLE